MFIINVQNIRDKIFNSRSQQKGATKLKWKSGRENLGDFELTANQIARKICHLQICEMFCVHKPIKLKIFCMLMITHLKLLYSQKDQYVGFDCKNYKH